MGGTIPSMMLADTQQQRLLKRPRQAGKQPVAFAELHACGIDFPAAVVSELELHGYAIDRVYNHGRLIGVRLLHPEPPNTPTARRRQPAAAPIASRRTPRDHRRQPTPRASLMQSHKRPQERQRYGTAR